MAKYNTSQNQSLHCKVGSDFSIRLTSNQESLLFTTHDSHPRGCQCSVYLCNEMSYSGLPKSTKSLPESVSPFKNEVYQVCRK